MQKELAKLVRAGRADRPRRRPGGITTSSGATSQSQVVLVHKPELVQSQIRIGYPGLPRGHTDEAPLQVASTILGGGFTSRLVEAIRIERSLGYFASCQSVQEGRAGVVGDRDRHQDPDHPPGAGRGPAEVERFGKKVPATRSSPASRAT